MMKRSKFEFPEGSGKVFWAVGSEKGAVQFVAKKVGPECLPFVDATINGQSWMAYDVGRHSPRPMWEGEEPWGPCHILEMVCYYDGSGIRAHEWMDEWAKSGGDEEVIWRKLERYCLDLFQDCG